MDRVLMRPCECSACWSWWYESEGPLLASSCSDVWLLMVILGQPRMIGGDALQDLLQS